MKFCIFEAPSKKMLYFLGYIVFAYIRELIEFKLNEIFKNKKAQFFEFTYFYTIGDLSCGLFILIFNDSLPKLDYISLKRVLYLSIYDLLAQSCTVIYFFIYANDGIKIEFENLNITLLIDTTSRFILDKIRLGMKFSSHFYLSITIYIISFIFLSISDIFYFLSYSDEKKNWIFLFLGIIGTILYAFENAEGKIGLSNELLNVYSLLFYKGIIQSCFLVIIAITFLALKQYYLFIAFFDNNCNIFFTIIIIFSYVMLNLFSNICIWKIIDNYTIQHLILARGGLFLTFPIISLIKGEEIVYPNNMNKLFFTDFFGSMLLFIGALIHNEIIIFNCCGLNKYTHKQLLVREKTDLEMAKRSESCETKDINENINKNEEEQSNKEEYIRISELSENFISED